jgi:putative ABC transport system permease protein
MDSVRIAWAMLKLHKLRAFLTMFGVIVGVMAVTLIGIITEGFNAYMAKQFNQFGTDSIYIVYDNFSRRGRLAGRVGSLQQSDVDYIMNRTSTLRAASAALTVPVTSATVGSRELRGLRIQGVDSNVHELNQIFVESGRNLTAGDSASKANVCVIGKEVASELFPNQNPLGQFVTFQGISLQVVGVLPVREVFGSNNKKEIWLPLSTAHSKWVGGNNVSVITVRPRPGISVTQAMDDTWAVLMNKSNNQRLYRLDSSESISGTLTGIIGVAGAVLAGVAALALIVGGIGIMNIMLVSVTERTKEIGLRKAVGAPSRSIRLQFLVESAVLSLLGGCVGMGLALLFGNLIGLVTKVANWPQEGGLATPFPWTIALVAAGVSTAIGVIFGLYPAIKASNLSPIEALRTE